MRGATQGYISHAHIKINFNPRSPCGERRKMLQADGSYMFISTHAPHAGSDWLWSGVDTSCLGFQPTLPMRGATHVLACNKKPRERFQPTLPMRGATYKQEFSRGCNQHFNPRSPCGERPLPVHGYGRTSNFNPRSPCGERLFFPLPPAPIIAHFNPRSPCGERRRL